MADKSKKLLIILAVLFICAPLSFAGDQTGQELLMDCIGAYSNEVQAAIAPIHCVGYIDGIIDAHGILTTLAPEAKLFCAPPSGISVDDALQKVVSFLTSNPQEKSASARVAVLRALSYYYPCPK
jgi:hypothetical protein